MYKTITKITVAVLLSATTIGAKAQTTEPIFEISAGNAIANTKFLLQSSTGELISGNDLKLFAIDPVTKSVLWANTDFLGLDESDITIIEGTPFIKIERQKTLSLAKNKNTYIIQARDGKVVYDSKDQGIKVRNTLILPRLNGLLIESVKDGFLSVTLLDFNTAKELWTVPLIKEKTGGIGIGALKRAVKSYTSSAFSVAPIVDANQNLILVNKSQIFAIGKNGQLAWKKEYDDDVDDAYLGQDGNSLFIGYKKYIDKISTANGNSTLAEPIKMRDALNSIVPMGDKYIVCNEAGINIMDASGNMQWKKDCKLGNITQAKYTANGIVAIEAVKDDETVFYWVDNEGKKMWDEKVKGGMILAEPTDKGVMYVTTERANILTYEKGKDVWNKDIKLKGVPRFGADAKSKTLYAFADGKVHAFNFSDNTYKLLTDDLDLKKYDDEKEIAVLDVREEGNKLVVYTNQNVAALQTADGKIIYNNYFKDIGNSKKKLMRFAGTALSVAGAAQQIGGLTNITGGTAGLFGGNGGLFEKGANQYNTGSVVNDLGNSLYAAASKRYLASQATKDNLYILSEMPEGNGMLVWNKDKGTITKKITFKDTTPQYVVDEAADKVYVVVGNVIKAYDLK
ncbi:MAG: PQQ-binding-like beta-propeller repeat protein [Bacteroidetes bacterium]|nr:PQQ-binding-like beta-propeller repeat protein [Bacteroidota bacterium]